MTKDSLRATEIRKRVAALRPKISKQEAAKRRQASLKGFKTFEIVSIVVLAVVLIALTFLILAASKGDEAGSEALFNATLLFWSAVTLQSALMIRTSFVRLNRDNYVSEDRTDHPFRGWRFTPFTPLLGAIILLPLIISGVYNTDDVNAVGAFFLMLVLGLIAFLIGFLVAAFIIAPIEALTRGIIALAKGDKTKIGYIYFGLFVAALTSFIIVGTLAVDPHSPYPAGSFQVALALLGIPGNYSIESEALLWVARLLIVGIIAAFVVPAIRKRRIGK
ncbi:MAG: hypothetical protein WAQ27_03135 [Candidatus Microsaccharimonas sp.]